MFFIINGLNHLREWIAPNNDIFKNSKYFKDINNICNGIKHLKPQNKKLKTFYNSNVNEWKNVDDILDVDIGSPSDYFVDNKNIFLKILSSKILKEVYLSRQDAKDSPQFHWRLVRVVNLRSEVNIKES